MKMTATDVKISSVGHINIEYSNGIHLKSKSSDLTVTQELTTF